jgi:hypothetical protein
MLLMWDVVSGMGAMWAIVGFSHAFGEIRSRIEEGAGVGNGWVGTGMIGP